MKPVLLALACVLAISCKAAERSEQTPAPDNKTKPEVASADPLPAEAPLEQVIDLPAEATDEVLEARFDRALELLDAMFETIVEHGDDCDKMATSLERFVEVNRAMIENLRGLEQHKQLIETRFKPKIDAWIKRWIPKITEPLGKCMSNPRVTRVFQELSDEQNKQ